MDILKFCCSFCDLDFVHSNFKVIQYLMFTIAFKLDVLSQSSKFCCRFAILAIPSLAVSCFINKVVFEEYYDKIFFIETLVIRIQLDN